MAKDITLINNDLKQEIENILLLHDNIDFCSYLLLNLTFHLEYEEWIQSMCTKIILSDRDENLCSLAITCLGHLARIHEKLIKKDEVVDLLYSLKEKNKFLGTIDDALDDINQFT